MNTRISEGTASSQRICKEVAELKRLAEAATPGPWRHEVIDPSDPEWGACEVFSDSADSFVSTHVTKEVDAVYIAAANPASILELLAQRDELRAALEMLLKRDERNTCQHEETHRGGAIWEICNACGSKWADDEGGKPRWVDPIEWDEARAAIANATKGTTSQSAASAVDVEPSEPQTLRAIYAQRQQHRESGSPYDEDDDISNLMGG